MIKTILITGSTDGIGRHLARKLAGEGHRVLIHGRDSARLAAALAEIKALSPKQSVYAYQADFVQMGDVYRLCEEIKRDFEQLDVLINNAGIYAGSERSATAENIELTFMLSVMVPYILTVELLPLLEAADAGRIINTSSYMHHFARVREVDYSSERYYRRMRVYSNAKLYMIWLSRYQAQELARQGSPVTINSYHPGLIATDIGQKSRGGGAKPLFSRLLGLFARDLDRGIETAYYLAVSDQVAAISGQYFDSKKIKRVSYKGYSDEKVRQLLAYCDSKIAQYRQT